MTTNHEILGNMPARVTLERRIGGAFHYWLGRSGRRYLHTIFPVRDCPAIENAVYVGVRREPDGSRRAIAAGLIDPFRAGRQLAEAASLGADEIHLHLLAETLPARRDTLADLCIRHLPERIDQSLAPAA